MGSDGLPLPWKLPTQTGHLARSGAAAAASPMEPGSATLCLDFWIHGGRATRLNVATRTDGAASPQATPEAEVGRSWLVGRRCGSSDVSGSPVVVLRAAPKRRPSEAREPARGHRRPVEVPGLPVAGEP